MKEIALFAGFILIGIAGCFAVFQLGHFLESVQRGKVDLPEEIHLRVAASDFCMAQSIAIALKGMRVQHPNMQCTLTVGAASDVLQWFASGDVDVIAVPAYTQKDERKNMPFASQRLAMDDGCMVLETVDENMLPQKVLWKKEDGSLSIVEFLEQFCRQKKTRM